MRFFCPRCDSPVPAGGESARVQCGACGLAIDLTLLNTAAGVPSLPLVWDFTAEQIGPYRLEEALGSGGMGTVYRAIDVRSGAPVAVKVLFPHLGALPDLIARFKREAKALQALQHPRIVRYIDDGEFQGRHYLVMEYVAGENLEQFLKKQKLLPETILDLAAQICEALSAAHAAGIVHRDLKPANVIVSGDGIRVLDFGIAQMTSEDRTLTHSDAILGTVNYMSPEQRLRGLPVDHRSDIYALGVMLYFMLTGRLPLGAFPPASRLNRHIPRRYDQLIARTLQSDPDRRYQSASELLAALRRLRTPARSMRLAAAALVLVASFATGWYLWALRTPAIQDSKEQAVVKDVPQSAPAPRKQDEEIPSELLQDELTRLDPKLFGSTGPATSDEVLALAAERLAQTTVKDAKLPPSKVFPAKAPAENPLIKARKGKPVAKRKVEVYAVDRDGVPLYQAPVLKSKPIGSLTKGESVTVVRSFGDKLGVRWLQVETEDGRAGMVPASLLQAPDKTRTDTK